jgi:hypothetical protein
VIANSARGLLNVRHSIFWGTVALFVLGAAVARTGVVAPNAGEAFGVASSENGWELVRRTVFAEQIAHDLHRLVDVTEEVFVPSAQIVQPRLLRRAWR